LKRIANGEDALKMMIFLKHLETSLQDILLNRLIVVKKYSFNLLQFRPRTSLKKSTFFKVLHPLKLRMAMYKDI